MRYPAFLLTVLLLFQACGEAPQTEPTTEPEPQPVAADLPFPALDTFFLDKDLHLAEGLNFQLIYQQGMDALAPNGQTVPAPKDHDLTVFLPIDGKEDEGWLWINHESNRKHEGFTDGGGGSILHLRKSPDGNWNVIGLPRIADFGPVGGTTENCLGGPTPWGTVLTSEEMLPWSNAEIYNEGKGMRDTSDYDGRPRYLNYGWMTEVDPVSGKALRKYYGMGRFMHEGVLCMPDSQTVYLLDDEGPGLLFKFVADNAGTYESGQLYAYKQGPGGVSGDWLALPMERDSLNDIRAVALRMGATFFIRLEDIEHAPGGGFFLTETGKDNRDLSQAIAWGGQPAEHIRRFDDGNGVFDDVFGRILHFDPESGQMDVWLEGGAGMKHGDIHLSNPDNLAMDTKRGYMVICEDLNGSDRGRVPAHAEGTLRSEVYLVNMKLKHATPDDLIRIAVIPAGAEPTGPCWSPDFSTLFLNIQHPAKGNAEPFNKATTIAIRFPE